LRFHRFEIHVSGREHLAEVRRGGLVVANHLSIWDIPVLASELEAIFVSTQEVRATPLAGWIARLCGSVFVERRNRAGLQGEIRELSDVLAAGQPVILFPEGTSTDGGGVLPFRPVMFRAAIAASVPVRPVCLQYETLAGEPVGAHNRDRLFFFGDQQLVRQMFRVLSARRVRLTLSFLKPIHSGGDIGDHKALAGAAYQLMTNTYRPILN
jgi:1-acyl-sn-glycerol-3-phosphate acyltransferase